MELKRIDVEGLLNEMSLTQYYRWLAYLGKNGLPHRNQERLLQQLNAGVLNASGRLRTLVTATDFDWRDKQHHSRTSLQQNELNQILSESASIRKTDNEK
ncbi:hypothetical protein [Vibrio barjaei]|uniref:hypothetical protein n=1 Tax=Vibrio barjaei TaxID=1676683 RepID=UPI003749FD01